MFLIVSQSVSQTEHSRGPLGDPSARVFEVLLIVSRSLEDYCTACLKKNKNKRRKTTPIAPKTGNNSGAHGDAGFVPGIFDGESNLNSDVPHN